MGNITLCIRSVFSEIMKHECVIEREIKIIRRAHEFEYTNEPFHEFPFTHLNSPELFQLSQGKGGLETL